MVLPTRRRPYVVELLLVVSVCLLMALSASELLPPAPADLDGVRTTQGTAPEPEAHTHLPQPDGHGALHALSLCVAVVVLTGGLALLRTLLLAGGHAGRPPAAPVTYVRYSRPLRLGLSSSQVAAHVLLRV